MAEEEMEGEETGSQGGDSGGSVLSGCMSGCSKLLLLFMMMNACILVLLLVVSMVIYFNWEKFGPPMIAKAEEKLVSMPVVEQAAKQLGYRDMSDLLEKLEKNLEDIDKGIEQSNRGRPMARGGIVSSPRPYAATVPFVVNSITYGDYANRQDVLVLVEFYTSWFEPSKQLKPMLVRLAQQHGNKVIILKVDIEKNRDLADRLGVRLRKTKEYYNSIKEEVKNKPDKAYLLKNVERSMGIPSIRILLGGRPLTEIRGVPTYEQLEQQVLRLESKLPPPPQRPTLPAGNASGATPGGSPAEVGSGGLPPGITRGKKQ